VSSYKHLTYEDVMDIKFYSDNGMSDVDIAYAMDIHKSTVGRVLKNIRKRHKTERGIKRKLMGELGTKTTGNSVVRVGTDDTEQVSYECQQLPEDYDPTLEMAALLERIEHEEEIK
jgi:IS30 family transposase